MYFLLNSTTRVVNIVFHSIVGGMSRKADSEGSISSHQLECAEFFSEAEGAVETEAFGQAIELHVLDFLNDGMGKHLLHELGAQPFAAVICVDDDIEEDCLEDVVGQDAGEGDEASGGWLTESENEVGVGKDGGDLLQSAVFGPPFLLIELVEVMDLALGEGIDELEIHIISQSCGWSRFRSQVS